ncbi:hypothetical protein BKA62DRAFT_762283 [Auriculariales sp. MPI-PUGE-AT-0066]|nr:hypothetical protein BKA62DRAFT_762283 [Auriculariales sp. MPI-PUGE-AT-0066]
MISHDAVQDFTQMLCTLMRNAKQNIIQWFAHCYPHHHSSVGDNGGSTVVVTRRRKRGALPQWILCPNIGNSPRVAGVKREVLTTTTYQTRMGDIAVPLLTADWTPNAQGYHGTFEFSRCPKSGLEQTFGNDTSQLQSFDHLQTHTLSLPTELDAWPFMTGFQFFGVLLYNDDSLVVSPARTINAVWNVPGNSCVYFEFQVVSPGDTVPSGADPCNPPVAKLSFAGIDALRTDYEMVVTNAYLVGPFRPVPTEDPGEPSTEPQPSSSTVVCSRAVPTSVTSIPPHPTDSAPPSSPPNTNSKPTSAPTTNSNSASAPQGTESNPPSFTPTSTSSMHSTTNTSSPSGDMTGTESASSSGIRSTTVAGIAAGSIAALFFLVFAVAWLRHRAIKRRHEQETLETVVPYDGDAGVVPYLRAKEQSGLSGAAPSEHRAEPVVEETGFRDFYSAMRRAGLTLQSLLEHHSGTRDRNPDKLPEYTAG